MTGSILESDRQMFDAGRQNFVAIQLYGNIKLDKCVITDEEGNNKTISAAFDEVSNLYVGTNVFEPYKSFKMTISGYDGNSLKKIPSTTVVKTPQIKLPENQNKWKHMGIELIPPRNTTVLYGSTVTLVCKVTAYPRPDITWENNDGYEMPAQQYELYLSTVYISYIVIENFTENKYFYCKAINGREKRSARLELKVYRPNTLEITEDLKDTQIKYLSEGKLEYSISAYPSPTIQWYHNGSKIYSTNYEYEIIENGLVIRNMTLDTTGSYECEVKNAVGTETMRAEVTISGLDVPEVDLEEKVIVKPGDWKEIECRITKGFPKPTLTWTYKATDSETFSSLPEEIYVYNEKLKFGNVQKKHAGIYKCTAENFVGSNSKEMVLEVEYPPSIQKSDDKMTVFEGNSVALPCKVEAVPAAVVEWKRNGEQIDRNMFNLDQQNTLSFQARGDYSGLYNCSATNDLGTDSKSIVVDVLVRPYVDILPKKSILYKRVGDSLNLTCNIVKGNPAPSIMWSFIASKPVDKKSIQGIRAPTVYIPSLKKDHDGYYQCIAKNSIETDRVGIEVKVI